MAHVRRLVSVACETAPEVVELVDGLERLAFHVCKQNMIKVFESWCYQRMLCISWTEHVTNEDVFNRANTKPTLLDGLLKRRLAFHGYLVRKGGITLDLMIGRLHGTRPRGRPKTTWLKDLATHENISYKEAITIPRDTIMTCRSWNDNTATEMKEMNKYISVAYKHSKAFNFPSTLRLVE